MPPTTFNPGTVIPSAWLNDVNTGVFTTLPAKADSAALAAANGSSLVGFQQAGTGAIARAVQAKLRESVSVKDFGAKGDGITDDTVAFTLALNSGMRSLFIPNGTYILSGPLNIQAASLGICVFGEDKQNTVLQWTVNTGTTSKFATLLDAYVTIETLTLKNAGNDVTNSGGIVSYTPTTGNGFHDGRLRNVRLQGWGVGIGSSIDGTSLTVSRSQVFSCVFDDVEFNGCGVPIRLGVGANNNVWIRPAFLNNKGLRHIYINQGSTNLFLSPQFEPVDSSVTTGFLNAEFVLAPNNVLSAPYFEPCYGVLADSSPGTAVDNPLIEGFDWTIGTLSSSAILRSTDVSNSGVFAAPMISRVSLPVCRAASNPTSYCASDDNTNTVTLVDGFTSRDANFKLKPSSQNTRVAVNTQGSWTPTITGSTAGGAGNTYSQQFGQWVRVGNMVTAWFRLALTAKDGALAGNAQISGLPFSIASLSLYTPSVTYAEYFVDLSAGYTQLAGEGVQGTTKITIVQGGDNVAASALPVAGINASTVLVGQLTYITDAP